MTEVMTVAMTAVIIFVMTVVMTVVKTGVMTFVMTVVKTVRNDGRWARFKSQNPTPQTLWSLVRRHVAKRDANH